MSTPSESNANPQVTVRPSRGRAIVLHLTLVALAVALLVKAAQVQLVDGEYWAARGERQHTAVASLPAPRGIIAYDNGVPIAVSREQVQLTISPNQLRPLSSERNDRDTLARELTRLGVSRDIVRRATDTTRKYVAIRQLFLPSEARTLMSIRGVSSERTMQRLVSGPGALRELVGRVDADGAGKSGLELALDSVLTGRKGTQRAMRDARGRAWNTPSASMVDSRAGHSVRLTINGQLQEITERELLAALSRTGASGGDLVVLDPNDGAILALAGARNGRIAPAVTPLTEAYQPGSVLKPFFVARLIDDGRTSANSILDTENGRWTLGTRVFSDEHKAEQMSVFDVVRWSSNIGTIKLVTNLMTPDEEYTMLRDYGFGVPTGLPYPAESRGLLANPTRWTSLSAASMAIGYEIAVTPVQLALAYAAVANGGELLEPALVREIRTPEGDAMYRHERRVVRRVATGVSAGLVREMLKAVVDSGTGKAAGLAAFEVGGKSGTAQRAGRARGARMTYDATFAGMFPMSDPQVVVVARLIEPKDQYFGGVVAGPMVREVLRGALAARDAALDRKVLQRVARELPITADTSVRRADAERGVRLARADDGSGTLDADDIPTAAPRDIEPTAGRVIVSLPYTPTPTAVDPRVPRVVPSVRGLTMREAARTLYAAGFRVDVRRELRRGLAGRTRPAAGTTVRTGTVILLEDDR